MRGSRRGAHHSGSFVPTIAARGAAKEDDAAMLSLTGKRVFLACGRTDMRKSIDGLAAIVEGSFNLDPFDGALFVFCILAFV
jgi:transposase